MVTNMEDTSYPIIVFHNVTSSSRCTEFVKIAAGMGYKTLIITGAQGAAAQRGLPSAQKLAFKSNINFMALANLDVVKELFEFDEMIIFAPPPYGKENLTSEVITHINNQKSIIIFGGNDPGISRKDLEKGDKIVQIPAGDLGSIGTLTLGLALFTKKFGFL